MSALALAPPLPRHVWRASVTVPAVEIRTSRASRAERRRLEGLRRRDPATLAGIYEEYGGTTFAFLRRALGDRGAAEDVQQQVFLEVWQRGPSFDPERASLLTWILTIARSRAIDHHRRRAPEPRDPTIAAELSDRAAAADQVDELDALVGEWRVAHLLGRLPEEEADLLRRRFCDGRTQSEIAAATGVPLGTVKMRMVQGLDRLRELIEIEERAA